MAITTYNFKLEEDVEELKGVDESIIIRDTFKDDRTGFYVQNFVPDVKCYLNYLDLLMYFRSKWVSNAYLDLGLVPLIYGPSFMQDGLASVLLNRCNIVKLEVIPMPYTSFLTSSNKDITDYWIKRSVAAEYLGCDELAVTTRDLVVKLMGGI